MTMTPDQCFNQMALLLNMPEDSGYEGILENLKFLKEENIKMKKEYLKIINLGEKKCPNQERGWSETMDPCMAKLFKKSKYCSGANL